MAAATDPALSADWPQWGGGATRNMAAAEVNLPVAFVPGKKSADGLGIDLATTENVRWAARLGTETYSSPTVAGGRVFIATNDRSVRDSRCAPTGGGLLMCLDEATGRLLWQLQVRKLTGLVGNRRFRKYSNFNTCDLGICSSPTVDGNRVYVVTNRGEVLALDVNGLANGNDGVYHEELQYLLGTCPASTRLTPTDPDILWRFDMLTQLSVFPHDANCCSVLVHGDVLYVGTANGVDDDGPPYPNAPTLIALDKRTGRLVGYDTAGIGARVFHGQWSSPTLAQVARKTLILYGGGDGVCYAFEALRRVPEQPTAIKCAWSCDCNPPEYRSTGGKPIDYWAGDVRRDGAANNNDGQYVGPSEIIATPVFYRGRVYVAIGQDPEHGRGKGAFTCIDPRGSGDITRTGKVWTYGEIQRSLCTAAVADGLVYVADVAGDVHCLDAETGHRYWVHHTCQEAWTSLLVADGKLYLGTKKNFWVLAAGRQTRVLAKIRLGTPVWSAPTAANGTLYVASQKYLWAIRSPARIPPKTDLVQHTAKTVQQKAAVH
jgi:outer membrane protein assembly factor BamB